MTNIEGIRERCEKATPGPWEWQGDILAAPPPAHIVLKPYHDDDTGGTTIFAWPDDAEFIVHAREDIPFLLAEVERLANWINDLQSGMYVNCVYCGHRYGPKESTPSSMADVLKQHIENCPQHPMSALKREVARLTAERDAAVRDIYHMGGCPNCKKNFGQNENTGLPKCAEHRDFPNGDCFEWRGAEGKERAHGAD